MSHVIWTPQWGRPVWPGLHAGVWAGPDDFAAAMASGRTFEARLAREEREELIAGWEAAVGGTLAVAQGS
ncbi:MAG: hypothetical protein OXQ94_11695 [Gemmatimonadota bacterium]|nr:hypothetical protein [Gemmatimonadota bacterium]MDE2872331.1 hypothetical protein [Gemmatimonadota bacterium]